VDALSKDAPEAEPDKESAAHLIDPRANAPPVERVSESIMSSQVDQHERDGKADPPKNMIGPVSSGQIEIGGPESLINEDAPPLSASTATSIPPPPSAIIANAMGRNQKLPLRTIVAIGAAVVVVAIGLSLLLFR